MFNANVMRRAPERHYSFQRCKGRLTLVPKAGVIEKKTGCSALLHLVFVLNIGQNNPAVR
jgi:hypothetical protein